MNCLIVGKDMEPDPWAKSEFFAWNDGRRIVDLGELAKQLHCKQCSSLLDLQRTERETRCGFASILYIHCNCGLLNDVHTARVKNGDEKSRKNSPTFDINVKASINLLMYGVGSHILSFLTLLDIPVPNPDDACLTVPVTSDTATSHVPPALPSATTSIKSAVTASDTSVSAQPTSAVSQTAQSFQTSLPLLSSSDLSVSSVPEVLPSVNNDGGDAVQAVDSNRVVISNVDHPHNNRLGKGVSDEEEEDNGDECFDDEDDDYVPPAELKLRLKPKPAPSPPKRGTSRKSKNTRAKSAAKTKRVTPRRTVKLKIKVKDVITENDVKLAEESDGDKKEEEKEDTGIERNSKDFDNPMEWSSTESEQESSREKESTTSQLEEEQQSKDEEEAKLGRKRGRPRGSTDRGKRARKSEARIQKEAVPPETQGAAGETKEFPTCKVCAKDFNSIKGYNVHMKRVHNQDMKEKVDPIIYVCSLCKQPFARDYSVISHLEKKHWTPDLDPKDNYVSIPLEGSDTASSPEHSVSSRKREDIESASVDLDICLFVCEVCQQPYARDYGVISHIEYKHWAPDIKPKDNYVKVPLKDVIREKAAKKGERKTRFSCLCCGREGMSRTDITAHICAGMDGRLTCLTLCPTGKTLIRNDRRLLFYEDKRRLLCPTCGAMFSEKLNLDSHLLKEHGIMTDRHKKHHCKLCDKVFTRKSGLDIHRARVHTQGEKPSAFMCDYCGESFTSMNSLYCHRKYSHVVGRAYQCQFCPKKFFKRHLWITHTRRHLGEKPYLCEVCQKDFTCNSNLVTHMRIHSGLRPYKCPACQADFVQRSSLVVHVKRRHPSVPVPHTSLLAASTSRRALSDGGKEDHAGQPSVREPPVHNDSALSAVNKVVSIPDSRLTDVSNSLVQ